MNSVALIEEMRIMWLDGLPIEDIADRVVKLGDQTPLSIAHYFHCAFNCGGHSLVKFANAYCNRLDFDERDALIQVIEANQRQWDDTLSR